MYWSDNHSQRIQIEALTIPQHWGNYTTSLQTQPN